MTRLIIQIKDRYFEWSTVVDAPITYGLTREELRKYYKEEYGNYGMRTFEEKMSRVDRYGTSLQGRSAQDVTRLNRAGPEGSPLSLHEIYNKYKSPALPEDV